MQMFSICCETPLCLGLPAQLRLHHVLCLNDHFTLCFPISSSRMLLLLLLFCLLSLLGSPEQPLEPRLVLNLWLCVSLPVFCLLPPHPASHLVLIFSVPVSFIENNQKEAWQIHFLSSSSTSCLLSVYSVSYCWPVNCPCCDQWTCQSLDILLPWGHSCRLLNPLLANPFPRLSSQLPLWVMRSPSTSLPSSHAFAKVLASPPSPQLLNWTKILCITDSLKVASCCFWISALSWLSGRAYFHSTFGYSRKDSSNLCCSSPCSLSLPYPGRRHWLSSSQFIAMSSPVVFDWNTVCIHPILRSPFLPFFIMATEGLDLEFYPFRHGVLSLLYLRVPPMNLPHTVGLLVLSKGWLLRVLSSV